MPLFCCRRQEAAGAGRGPGGRELLTPPPPCHLLSTPAALLQSTREWLELSNLQSLCLLSEPINDLVISLLSILHNTSEIYLYFLDENN